MPRWSVNCVTLSGFLIFHGNSLFGITVGPAALAGPLAYPCANLGFSGEVTPADEKLLLSRGITRNALRHTLVFVLRSLVAIHSRHRLPAIPSLPDHRAHISGNEHLFLSWIEPHPEEHLPSTWSFSAPRAIQWPHPAILRWVVTVFAMSLSVPQFITGGGSPKVLHDPYIGFPLLSCRAAPRLRSLPRSASAFSIFRPRIPPPPSYSLHGRVVWSMECGYPSRHLSLWLDTKLPVVHRQAALRLVMRRALSLVGVPPRHSYADIMVALLEVDLHKKTAWATLLV